MSISRIPNIVRAVNRYSGAVFEGKELTPHLKLYINRNPEHFKIFLDEDEEDRLLEEVRSRMISSSTTEAPSPVEPPDHKAQPAKVPLDTSAIAERFTHGELMSYTTPSLATIAEDLGASVKPGMSKKALVELIMEAQEKPVADR